MVMVVVVVVVMTAVVVVAVEFVVVMMMVCAYHKISPSYPHVNKHVWSATQNYLTLKWNTVYPNR